MKKYRVLSLMLAFVMVITLASCGKQSTQQEQASSNDTTAAEQSTAENDESWKTGEPTKISWFRSGISQKCLANWADAEWVKELEKRMNVSIEFQGPKSTDDYNQAAAIMLNSGTLSDIFHYNFSNYDGGVTAAIEDGIIVDVYNKYRDKVSNYYDILDKYPDIRKQVTADDGSANIFNHVEVNMERMSYWGLGIRQDWLNKLNLQTPTTIDELENVLVAFRDQDPNGNGQKDEIPFSDYYLAGANYMFAIMNMTAPFGMLYSEVQQDPYNEGNVTYWILVNEGKAFQDCVTMLNKWYKEGLLDPEFAIQDGTALEAKVTSDRVGTTHVWPSGFNTWNAALRKVNPDADMEGLAQVTGEAGKAYSANSALVKCGSGSQGNVITSKAEDDGSIDACLRVINYLYSEEGSDLINWGPEGVSYTANSDGTKSWTDTLTKDPEYSLNDLQYKYALPTYGDWPKVMSYDAWASIELNSEEAVRAHDAWFKADKGLLLPNLVLGADESSEYARIMSDVNTAITENFIKFIIGTRPVSEVPQLVQQCKDLGLEDAMAMYQKAWERYNSK